MPKTPIRKLITTRRLFSLTVISGFLLFAGAMAVFGAPKHDFSVSATPATQTVSAGSSASYALNISRSGGYSGPVSLSVAGLPGGTAAALNPPSPVTGSTITMSVPTSGLSGTYNLSVNETGGGVSHTTPLTLVVQPSQSFNLELVPLTQTVTQDDTATYGISLSRINGFAGPVALSVSGLPKRTTGTFSPATVGSGSSSSSLTVITDSNAELGSFSLTITGTGGGVTKTATAVLNVAAKQNFQISGVAPQSLFPGGSSPIDLSLSNPNGFAVKVVGIDVAIDHQASNPACTSDNFKITPFSGTVLLPGKTSQVTVPPTQAPQITMLDKPTSQDACKHVTVFLHYTGTAVKP